MFCSFFNLLHGHFRMQILNEIIYKYRSSHQRCSVQKVVLRNFTKFTGKQLCQCLFLKKLQGLQLIKNETLTHVFSCEFCEISKKTFFIEHLRTTASLNSNKVMLNMFSCKFDQAL